MLSQSTKPRFAFLGWKADPSLPAAMTTSMSGRRRTYSSTSLLVMRYDDAVGVRLVETGVGDRDQHALAGQRKRLGRGGIRRPRRIDAEQLPGNVVEKFGRHEHLETIHPLGQRADLVEHWTVPERVDADLFA